MPIFSERDIEGCYHDPALHLRIHRLLLEHSTNKEDIRDFAFRDIDFRKIRHILDLGCAFGFSVRGLKGRLRRNTHILGLDLQETYRDPWLRACKEAGGTGEFHISDAAEIVSYPSDSFDMVVASYSMYFFPELAGEVSRILRPEGVFVAITHSREVLRELISQIPAVLQEFDVGVADLLSVQELLDTFSYENGEELLQPHFGEITRKLFRNSLRFKPGELGRFREYLEMKSHILLKEAFDEAPDSVGEIMERIMANLLAHAKRNGEIVFNKNDGVFICRQPLRECHDVRKPRLPRFCHVCGHFLDKRKIEGRKRMICRGCGYVVYQNPLPVVAVIVENQKGEILLVKRANQPMRGMWCLPTGFAEVDEDIEEAALRELKEETGIEGEISTLVDVSTSRNWFYGNLVMITYLLRNPEGEPMPGDDAAEVRYFSTDHLPPLAFRGHERAVRRYRRVIGEESMPDRGH
jgi:ADP-ribose pyrophosphatase YjhB (NUDIX family)/SAM-dependent methyltransferase